LFLPSAVVEDFQLDDLLSASRPGEPLDLPTAVA